MALAHVYQLTLRATLRDQAIRNVFFYRDLNENVPSEALGLDLWQAWTGKFVPGSGGTVLMQDIFSSELTYTGVEVVNITDPTVIVDAGFARSPAGLADLVSPFAAHGFRTARKRSDIRRGQKRFAGASDTSFTNGEVVAGVLTALDNIVTALEDDVALAVDPLTQWRQIIVGRVKYVTPGGSTAYRLPETDLEYKFFDARPWEINLFMTTQNTRKVGRGL